MTTNIHPALIPELLDEFLALPSHAGIPLSLMGLMIGTVTDRMAGDSKGSERLMAALSPAQCSAIEEWRAAQLCNRCGNAAGSKCWHTFELRENGFHNSFTCKRCLGRPQ
jgi:hypothetical protein